MAMPRFHCMNEKVGLQISCMEVNNEPFPLKHEQEKAVFIEVSIPKVIILWDMDYNAIKSDVRTGTFEI